MFSLLLLFHLLLLPLSSSSSSSSSPPPSPLLLLLLLLLLLFFEIFPTQRSREWIEHDMKNFLDFSPHSAASRIKWKTFWIFLHAAQQAWINEFDLCWEGPYKNAWLFSAEVAVLNNENLEKSSSFSMPNVDWTVHSGRGRIKTACI